MITIENKLLVLWTGRQMKNETILTKQLLQK